MLDILDLDIFMLVAVAVEAQGNVHHVAGVNLEDMVEMVVAVVTLMVVQKEFLDKDFLASVDPSKGRFRAFLLASLRNFLSHQREREGALKRGGGTVTISSPRPVLKRSFRSA